MTGFERPDLIGLNVLKCFLSKLIIQCSAHAHQAFPSHKLLVTKIDRLKHMKIPCCIVVATHRSFVGGLTHAILPLLCIPYLILFSLIHAIIGTGPLNDLFNLRVYSTIV